MLKTDNLIQLNAEIEGLLHVLSHRDSLTLRNLLLNKFSLYKDAFADLTKQMNENPVFDADHSSRYIHEEDKYDVQVEEGESNEMPDEDNVADDIIAHETVSGSTGIMEEEVMPKAIDIAQEIRGENEISQPGTSVNEEVLEDVLETHSFDDDDLAEIREGIKQPLQNDVLASTESQINVDEMLSRKAAVDLKHAFTLNDKFGFRRTLFDQDDAKFARALDELSLCASFAEAQNWMVENYGWDMENPNVDDFMSIIKRHYPK